jgi:hypothetical protein
MSAAFSAVVSHFESTGRCKVSSNIHIVLIRNDTETTIATAIKGGKYSPGQALREFHKQTRTFRKTSSFPLAESLQLV